MKEVGLHPSCPHRRPLLLLKQSHVFHSWSLVENLMCKVLSFVLRSHSVCGSAVRAWLSRVLCLGVSDGCNPSLTQGPGSCRSRLGLHVSSILSLLAKIQVLVVVGPRSHFLLTVSCSQCPEVSPLHKHFTHGCLISSSEPAWVSGKAPWLIACAARVENHPPPGIHKC